MTLERQYFACAATVLLAKLHFNGGRAIGFHASSDRTEWLMGELDAAAEMHLILKEMRLAYKANHRNPDQRPES